jgi:hypothetical protein
MSIRLAGLLRGSTAFRALALTSVVAAAATNSAPVVAQDYTQVNATGRVLSTDGEPIADATVTVTSNSQGFTRTVKTGGDGTYRVTALPPGSYTFAVSAPGFDEFRDAAVALNQGQSSNQFTLAREGETGEIVVTAGRVRTVDFDRNTTGAVINVADVASRIPVARDLTSVILLSPGAASGDNRFGLLPAINGASVSENAYFVNGLNITQQRNGLGAVAIPFDFYQSVETKTGGVPAEFGRFTGGFINAVTKSGSNEFHGGVTFNWEPNDLRSNTRNTYAQDNDASQRERIDTIIQLSGPIIKDHLFFYGIYNARSLRTADAFTGTISATGTGANGCVTNPSVCSSFADLGDANLRIVGTSYTTTRQNSPFYAAKIDAVIVDGQRLEGTYFNTSNTRIDDTYGTSTYSLASGLRYNLNTNSPGGYVSSVLRRSGGENYVLRYTGTFTNWLTLSGAYGVNKNSETVESNTPNLPSVTDQRGGVSTGIGNVNANANTAFDKRTFYRGDADVNFVLLGSHHVRGGYDREVLDVNQQIAANGGFQYTLATAPGASTTIDATTGLPGGTQYAIARTFVSGGQFRTINEAFYVQDSWGLFSDRLRLNLGIRNDKFENRNADGVAFFKVKNQWSPRINFAFDPTGDSRTKVFGSFDRYYLPVALNTNVRLAGGELDYDAYYRLNGLGANNVPSLGAPVTTGASFTVCPTGGPSGTACVVRNDGVTPDTGAVVASNLKPQSVDQIQLGFEHRIARWSFRTYYTQSKLNESLEDVALDQAIVPFCISQGKSAAACRAIWNGVHQYAIINPGRNAVVQLSDPLPGETTVRTVDLSAAALQYPQAERNLKSMTFEVERDFDGVWSLRANYVYSKLYGNIEGGVRSDNAQTDSGLTTSFDLPALVTGTYGYLPNDIRHNIKVYGSYRPVEWMTVGLSAFIQSPRRFGCYGRAPSSADFDVTNPGGNAGTFYGANAAYCNVVNGQIVRNPVGFTVINDAFNRVGGVRPTTLQVVRRGTALKSSWLAQINADAQFQLPTQAFDGFLRVSVFNVFNSKQVLRRNEFGTVGNGSPSMVYSLPTQYNAGRYARIQLGVNF